MSRTMSVARAARLTVAAVLVASVTAMAGASTAAAGTPRDDGNPASTFRDPSSAARPKLFWFWPGDIVEKDELVAELREMAAAGFGGANITELAGLGIPTAQYRPEMFQWGLDAWRENVSAAMAAKPRPGFTTDIDLGPAWPWTSPAVAGDNAGLQAQHLRIGQLSVPGSSPFVGPVPPGWAATPPAGARLVAATAARRSSQGPDPSGRVLLDADSAVNLTEKVDDQGVLHWDVPQGDWVLFGFWQAPTNQTYTGLPWSFVPNVEPPGQQFRVVDPLRRQSAEAALDYLDAHLFQKLGPQARAGTGAVQEENTEMDYDVLWTGDFSKEFRARRGYDLTPYLPAVFGGQLSFRAARGQPRPTGPRYDFPGGAGERLRRDYDQTLTDLWVDDHLAVTRKWANRHGLKFRAKAFGWMLADPIQLGKAVDVPMTQDLLAGGDTIDFWHTISSAAHLSGSNQVGMEVSEHQDSDYTWTPEQLKRRLDEAFAAGVNDMMLHLYPYKKAPGSGWPTWSPYSSEALPTLGISEIWNSGNPVWHVMPSLADYMGRAQTVLRAGKPAADVAVYRDIYGHGDVFFNYPPGNNPPINADLSRAGLTYDFVDPSTLLERSTDVRGGRLIVQDPGYRALVVDLDASKQVGAVDDTDAMDPAVARRLVAMARAGLPIVFIGRFPERGVSFRDPQGEDAAVGQAIDQLKRFANVRLVADTASVPAALAGLGVNGDVSYEGTSDVKAAHRRTADGDYWFLFNGGAAATDFVASFRTDRVNDPERWDLWSGDRRPVGLYRLAGDRVRVPLELGPGETTVIAFRGGARRDHVVATTADDAVVRDDGAIALRSTTNGGRTATLSDGSDRRVTFAGLPAPVVPDHWTLRVDGAVPSGTDTHDLQLTELADWRAIPEIKDSSGIGTYRAEVVLPRSWVDRDRGAYLELGTVDGAVQVSVNGTRVTPAAVAPPRIDVGPFLRAGSNTVDVEVTTTLKNRLVSLSTLPGFQRFALRPQTQPYGLRGPVRLVPYADRAITRGHQ